MHHTTTCSMRTCMILLNKKINSARLGDTTDVSSHHYELYYTSQAVCSTAEKKPRTFQVTQTIVWQTVQHRPNIWGSIKSVALLHVLIEQKSYSLHSAANSLWTSTHWLTPHQFLFGFFLFLCIFTLVSLIYSLYFLFTLLPASKPASQAGLISPGPHFVYTSCHFLCDIPTLMLTG